MKAWRLVALAGIAGTAVVAARWADLRAPASRTVGVIPVPGQAALPRPEGAAAEAPRAWRMVLRLDPDLRQPGPEWALREGMSPGPGYELAWQPGALGLLLTRGGEQPLLLGAVRLARPPREVVLGRRGARLAVTVDGQRVLEVLDPEGVAEPPGRRAWPDGWAVVTPSALGASTFAVHDESSLPVADASDLRPGDAAALAGAIALGPADAGERDRGGGGVVVPGSVGWRPPTKPGRPDHALLQVRRVLAMRNERDQGVVLAALGEASRAIAALGTAHPDRARLGLWLAWAEARNALATAGADEAARVRPALDQLIVLAGDRSLPEGPGMLLALLPGLADRALRRPPAPRRLDAILAERGAWLSTLDTTTQAALASLPAGVAADLPLGLRFISHACGALGGDGTRVQPLPADAPEWLAARWRTLAGGSPPEAGLPPPPASQVARGQVLPVVEALVRGAGLEPLAAVRLRSAITDRTLGSEELQRRQDTAGERESRLTALILALDGLAALAPPSGQLRLSDPGVDEAMRSVSRAAEALGDITGRRQANAASALVLRDPLAFALACLAHSRLNRLATPGLGRDPWRIPEPGIGEFVRLAPFAQLLSGDPAASELIWLHDDAVLPPAHALAAALAMREVREDARQRLGGEIRNANDPDWSLTARLRCYTLPLEMLDGRPRQREAGVRLPAAGP
jgi:hypothetical protein